MSQKMDIPESLSNILLGILLFLVGLYWLFSTELTNLKCKRLQLNNKVTCEVTYFSLLGTRTIPIPAGMLQGAETRSKGRRNGHGVVLLTEIEKIPMGNSGTFKIVASQKAEKINNFINNPEQISLEMRHYPDWLIVFLGIIFVVLVLFLVLVFLNFIEKKSSINKIQREIFYPYHEDDKSDF